MAAASSPNLANGFPTPGPQHPVSNAVMDHVFLMSNEEWKKAREEMNFDLIIVGSSICSYAVAERALSKAPKIKILIIERDPFSCHVISRIFLDLMSTPSEVSQRRFHGQ